MILLCGAALGLLFDLLRTARGYYRPSPWVAAAADLLFWIVATVALSGGLFYGNWGEVRFYVLVALLLGVGFYYWLASPVLTQLVRLLFRLIGWLIHLVTMLILKLIWAPILALGGLLWATVRVLWRWLLALATGIWRGLDWLSGLLLRPFVGPYRLLKLHYLLTKRRWRRTLRRWLFGPKHRR